MKGLIRKELHHTFLNYLKEKIGIMEEPEKHKKKLEINVFFYIWQC